MTELLIAVLTTACLVFAASAVAKARSRTAYLSFQMGLAETGLVRRKFLQATAAALVTCEAVVAVSTATGVVLAALDRAAAARLASSALALAMVLTSVLLAGVAIILRRGTRARCPCFGTAAEQFGRRHLARNAALLGALVLALVCAQDLGQSSAAGSALAASAGAVTGILLIRLDDLVDLFTPITAGRPQ